VEHEIRVHHLDGDQPGKKVVAIQFDDGWKSGQLALPVLDKYGFKATFWIIAGKGIGWPHMDWDEIETIARNPRYDIYSHTMTHPWKPGDTMLDWMSWRTPGKGPDQVRWELAESRRVLAEKLGRSVPYLAWPGGQQVMRVVRTVRRKGKQTQQVRYSSTSLGGAGGGRRRGQPAAARPWPLGD